jgi:hypothetical protein
MKGQVEGSMPPEAKGGNAPVSNGCATPKVRKASVSPSPSDKGSMDSGKA